MKFLCKTRIEMVIKSRGESNLQPNDKPHLGVEMVHFNPFYSTFTAVIHFMHEILTETRHNICILCIGNVVNVILHLRLVWTALE